jgi:hypothetical protein
VYKKKGLPPQKGPLLSQFLHYIHVTPVSGILSGFRIILQNFSETCSFREMLKNAPKGRFKNCQKEKHIYVL